MDIDFNNFLNEQSSERLIKLLLNIGTDVDKFKKAGFVYAINLIPYNKLVQVSKLASDNNFACR